MILYLYCQDPEKLANKLSDDEKDTIKDALKDSQDWLDKNQNAEKEDYEEELKELEKYIYKLIIQNLQSHH